MSSDILIGVNATRPQQVIWAGQGPVLLENLDVLNTVYLGSDEGMDPGGNDVSLLLALTSKGFDGTGDRWALTQSGTARVNTIAGGTSSTASPAAVAEQIALTGIGSPVPALIGPGQAVAAGVSWTYTKAPLSFATGAAYELILTPASTFFATDITVAHYDSAGLVLLFEETFTVHNVMLGAVVNNGGVIVRGNLHGPVLKITGQAATGTWVNTVLGASSILTGGFSISVYAEGQVQPGKPKVYPINIQGYLAFNEAATLPASSSLNLGPVAAYTGRAWMHAFASVGGGFEWYPVINCYQVANGTGRLYSMRFGQVTNTNNPGSVTEFSLDMLAHVLFAVNPSTIAGDVPFCAVVAEDYI